MKKYSLLPSLAIRKPVTIIMMLTAVLVIGVIAYLRITVELFPPGFSPPFLHVSVPYTNSNPREIEQYITRPIEEILQTVRNIREINSRSGADGAQLFVSFRQNADMDEAYNQVRDRIERVFPELPDDIERYYVRKYSADDQAVISLGISFDKEFDDPYYLVDNYLIKPLERIDGVANVEIGGLDQKIILIDLDQEKLNALHINVYPLFQRLQQDNFALSSGYLKEGGKKIYVRSIGKFDSIEEINNIQVRGTDIFLKDIATVRYDVPEITSYERIDGKPAVQVSLFKESTANTLSVTFAALAMINGEIKQNPNLGGMNILVFFDQGSNIMNALNNLEDTALWGGFFAFCILLFFLRRFRMTILIICAIPLSLVITIIALFFAGWSLNVFTLMGMMISVGLVIDNSIVIVENIYRRRLLGDEVRAAAITGASEVSTAILMATLTTIVVFLPFILMNDTMMSFYLLRIGIPIVAALLGSLCVALLIIPLIATRLPIKGHIKESRIIVSGRSIYERMLRWALSHRLDTSIIGLVLIASIYIPFAYMEKTDQEHGSFNEFRLIVDTQDNYSLEEANEVMERLESFIDTRRDKYGIKTINSRTSRRNGRILIYLEQLENNSWWYVLYRNVRNTLGIPVDQRLEREEILADLKATAPEFPGVDIRTQWWRDEDNQSVTVQVVGPETETLTPIAREVERRMRLFPQLANVETDLERGNNEVHLIIDRVLAQKYGVSAQEIAGLVSYSVRGRNLPDFRSDEREIDMLIQLEKSDRETLDNLRNMTVRTSDGNELPLSTFVQFSIEKGYGSIRRRDGKTNLSVRGYAPKASVQDIYAQIDQLIAGFQLPRGYSLDKGGRFGRWEEQEMAQGFALILAVTFVFILMGVLFESFVLPLSIIICIPFALFGAYWGLFISRTPFDMMAGIGLIVLIGIVVNNAIVLVDLVNRFITEGMSRHDAIIEAGKNRFRPIFMTAFTTIFGLVPMALGNSTLIGIPYAPLGRTIIGGIFTSTILTLIFVPLAYTYFDDLRKTVRTYSFRMIRRFQGGKD